MKTLLITLFVLAGTVFPAMATNLTSCGTITAVASYDLTGDITTTNQTCLEVNVLSGGNVVIDCHNYSIRADLQPLYVHDNVANITWQNCVLRATATAGGGVVKIWDNSGGTNSYTNVYFLTLNTGAPGNIWVKDSPYATFWYSGGTNTFIEAGGTTFYKSRYFYLAFSNFDLSTITADVACIVCIASPDSSVGGNLLTGNTTYVDDGILITASSGFGITSNEIHDVYDAGIEFVSGACTNGVVSSNSLYNTGIAGISGYQVHNTSLSGTVVAYNTVYNSPTGSYVFYFDGGPSGSSFSNNNFHDNTYSGFTTNGSVFGFSGHTWPTFSSNQFGSNHLGFHVDFQSSAGVTDNGSNYCSSVTPTGAIVCH